MITTPNTNLFGEAMPQNLVLEEPPKEQWNAMAEQLNTRCNKQQLLNYAESFIPWFSKHGDIFLSTQNGRIRRADEITLMVKNSTNKGEIARGVAIILASQQNLHAYVDSLSEDMKSLWRTLLLKNYLSQASAKRILKTKSALFNEQRSYYYYSGGSVTWNRREYNWFSTANHLSSEMNKYGYRDTENYITINNTMRGIFFPIFFSQLLGEGSHATEELPKGNWRTIELEADSQSHFKLLSSLIRQGEFEMKKKGIGQADIKRANKKLSMQEFFTNSDNPYQQMMRANFYLQTLVLNELKKNNKKKPINTYEETLKDLFNNLEKLDIYLPALIYPHIKGLRQTFTEWNHLLQLCVRMLQWMQSEPRQWVPIADIFFQITTLDSNGSLSFINTQVFHQSNEKSSNDVVNEYSQRYITVEHYTDEFGYTGLQSFAFLLCSLGLAEIALNEDEMSNKSPFAQLQYLRLTPLGRYVLGVTADYEAPEMEHMAYFELDPDRLIIRSLVNPNPYAQLLMDTSVPISANRFQTSPMSFLSNCHTREDVESKISIFRQFIADELPPLWQQFFQQLLQHCHPLMEDRISYRHYTLQPDNTELIQLITSDPTLQAIVIRAEGFRLLVKTEDIRKFETQLKKHGYLL